MSTTPSEDERLRQARRIAMDKWRFGGNREIAIQRDGEKCVKCGMTRLEHRIKYKGDITVDHIDGKGVHTPKSEKNNSLDNLQTLCRRCHGQKDSVKKLTPVQVINIRHARGSISGGKLAVLYGLEQASVYKIWEGVAWRHI